LDDQIEEARKLLEGYPQPFNHYHSYFLNAEILRRLGAAAPGPQETRVQQLLEKSIQLNPDFAPARASLGRIYASQQRPARAVEQFEAAIRLAPDDKKAHYELAQLYQRTGHPEKASQLLAMVRKLNDQERVLPPHGEATRRILELQKSLRTLYPR